MKVVKSISFPTIVGYFVAALFCLFTNQPSCYALEPSSSKRAIQLAYKKIQAMDKTTTEIHYPEAASINAFLDVGNTKCRGKNVFRSGNRYYKVGSEDSLVGRNPIMVGEEILVCDPDYKITRTEQVEFNRSNLFLVRDVYVIDVGDVVVTQSCRRGSQEFCPVGEIFREGKTDAFKNAQVAAIERINKVMTKLKQE